MDELIQELKNQGVLRSENIISAFRTVDRANFVPEKMKDLAYLNRPLPIGAEQTISQPATVAFMLELLQPQKGEKILDVGSGSGWTAALLSYLVGPTGRVEGLERVDDLVEFGQKNLQKYLDKFSRRNAQIKRSGKILGDPENAPYDKILVSAGAQELPAELFAQLREGGVMVIPIQNSIWRIIKKQGRALTEEFPGFVFVPLLNS